MSTIRKAALVEEMTYQGTFVTSIVNCRPALLDPVVKSQGLPGQG